MAHDYQVELRAKEMNEMVQKELATRDKEKDKIDGRLRNNLKCEEKLFELTMNLLLDSLRAALANAMLQQFSHKKILEIISS
jgi:hypothetical protein